MISRIARQYAVAAATKIPTTNSVHILNGKCSLAAVNNNIVTNLISNVSRPDSHTGKCETQKKPSIGSRCISFLTKCSSGFQLSKNVQNHNALNNVPSSAIALFHTTSQRSDLMEFFDVEKNWNKQKIQTGRSWRKGELRIKSNEDLHKLWYVLLKERNMLLTMEHACKEEYEIFPNPERIDKVAESMENIEAVVRERNEAYHLLEIGESGERPAKYISNVLGIIQTYRYCQHVIPRYMNTSWKKKHMFYYNGYAVRKFQNLYREKMWNQRRKMLNREKNTAIALIKKFPSLNIEALKKQYPSVNVDRILQSNKLKSLRLASRSR
ncbi:39S ribosomal protein L47, mitochondrial [Trichogramma pretiosum]|uniref:39S ribosomal protein L47, mitochondrial n=1 Tax=Trichogramma pretiosum TaxID=7493 RepID=UPI0006C96EF4|nr:39S ribosomal protein L47, mitochondrial [Trichogramma pretiosum]